jgi:hypothetical protein
MNIIIGEAFLESYRKAILWKRTNSAGKKWKTYRNITRHQLKLSKLENLGMEAKPEDIFADPAVSSY